MEVCIIKNIEYLTIPSNCPICGSLTKIEKEATTRLGMQRPEKYQTIYVNVKQDDMTEKTAGEVEGFGHGIVSVLKKIGGNIVQFFSIK